MTRLLSTHTTLMVLATISLAGNGEAQQAGARAKNLIQQEIDAAVEPSRWRLGPFRLTPRIGLGAGYDSNAFSSANEPIGDVVFRVAPGIVAAVPIGNRALVDVFEEVDFVYYKDLEGLRDIYNVTRVGGAFGGKNVVLRVQDEFHKEKARPTSELDYPLDQRTNRFGAYVDFALGWRHTLMFGYGKTRYRIEEDYLVNGTPVQPLLDRDENDYTLSLTRNMTAKTDLLVEGLYQILDYADAGVGRNAHTYGAKAGFAFSPRGTLDGEALLGYKRIIPEVEGQADYRGLVGSVEVGAGLGRRLRVRGIYYRDAQPSVQINNWFFIENRYGGYADLFLAAKLFLRPGVVLGTNDYPRPASFVDSEGETVVEPIRDRFRTYSLSVNFYLTERLILRLGTNYLVRDSNVRVFDKDRLLFNFGVTTDLWPRNTRGQSWF